MSLLKCLLKMLLAVKANLSKKIMNIMAPSLEVILKGSSEIENFNPTFTIEISDVISTKKKNFL